MPVRVGTSVLTLTNATRMKTPGSQQADRGFLLCACGNHYAVEGLSSARAVFITLRRSAAHCGRVQTMTAETTHEAAKRSQP